MIEIEISEEAFTSLNSYAETLGKTGDELAEEIILRSLEPGTNGVMIPCQGPCRNWIEHVFVKLDDSKRNSRAMVYACNVCGTERRYGLLSAGAPGPSIAD